MSIISNCISPFNNIMIDIETMGTRPNAAIIAIGAIGFNDEGDEHGEFYTEINLESSMRYGGTVDSSTIIWWMGQSDNARKKFMCNSEAIDIKDALIRLSNWIQIDGKEDIEYRQVWGNGPEFDNIVVSEAFRACGLTLPWRYWGNRSYREMKREWQDIVPQPEFSGVPHFALDDARHQVRHLKMILDYKRQLSAPISRDGDTNEA